MAAANAPLSRADNQILVASPRADFRRRILQELPDATVRATQVAGGADALMKLGESEFRTLLLDPLIGDLNVEELVANVRAQFPRMDVIVVNHEDNAWQRLLGLHESGPGGTAQAAAELDEIASAEVCEHPEALPGIIGTSGKMREVYRLVRLVAPRTTGVLIVGPTGTGKELVARAIHDLSPRSSGPLIVVNCAAIPESLLEAELFGFTRGAFTGAFQSRLGRIHAAHGGTLLLDEVGELPLSMQAKLLRFAQEGEVQRLGSADVFRVDARLIASTNVDLVQRVREKLFREDLYYRLAVFPIDLPPLTDRPEDILPLAEHFLSALAAAEDAPSKAFTDEAAAALQRYCWPGNVRELQHRIERAFVMAERNEQIRAVDLAMAAAGG